MATAKNFRDLHVWQNAHELVLAIYKISQKFPKQETYGLTSQIQRASVSVTSNIAEGFGRLKIHDKEHFYVMAGASLREVQNQLTLAKDLDYISDIQFAKLDEQAEHTHRQLNALLRTHRQKFGNNK